MKLYSPDIEALVTEIKAFEATQERNGVNLTRYHELMVALGSRHDIPPLKELSDDITDTVQRLASRSASPPHASTRKSKATKRP